MECHRHQKGPPAWWNDRGTGQPDDWNPEFWELLWHRIKGCSGAVVARYDDDGNLWLAQQCWDCGRIIGPFMDEDGD